MLGLENHPLYLMRNHFMALNAKKRAFDHVLNNDENLDEHGPVRKMIKHSSPQEKSTSSSNEVNGPLIDGKSVLSCSDKKCVCVRKKGQNGSFFTFASVVKHK